MSKMVERVARALCSEDGGNPDYKKTKKARPMWAGYADMASAGIKALRDPTWPMKDAMGAALWKLLRSWEGGRTPTIEEIDDIWRAAIDAALSE